MPFGESASHIFTITLLPRIAQCTVDELSGPITLEEVLAAIAAQQPGRALGPDGLTSQFYKCFRDNLAPALKRLFKSASSRGALPRCFTKAGTVLIPKKRDAAARTVVSSYRLITLTNTAYKILTKVLTTGFQQLVPHASGTHQTCGIKGRSIVTNMYVASCAVECCDFFGF